MRDAKPDARVIITASPIETRRRRSGGNTPQRAMVPHRIRYASTGIIEQRCTPVHRQPPPPLIRSDYGLPATAWRLPFLTALALVASSPAKP
ncbi:hypothetical protein MRS60_13470 [Burkholderia pyrrocinia]|uniref:hypothetical protein n=1 Tax=Burkholderia pyrrocinia TaxID=60550 RepID=UPI001FB4F147|nr:hypothetical protein [Burkholderia pyrrocinia]UOB54892.1 hypothetical protein MRS60_13470 [Burkholderia pyrrocinia]